MAAARLETKTCGGQIVAALNDVFDIALFWFTALVQLCFPLVVAFSVVAGPYCYASLDDSL